VKHRVAAQPGHATILVVCVSACSNALPANLTVLNVSDEQLYVEKVSAPEFAYAPPVGVLGRFSKSSSDAVKRPPTEVTVFVQGKPAATVRVPPLPADARGDIELLIIHTRSRHWASAWEITAGHDADSLPLGIRRVPEDDDPRFRLHRALIEAAKAGNVADVDRLLGQGAQLYWDTTDDSPLVTAAYWHRNAVIERLLRSGGPPFEASDIEDAIVRAADPSDEDVSTLRLLVARFGTGLSPEAPGHVLRKASASRQMDNQYRISPVRPVIRFLIEEAGFDVNLPVTDDGDTVFDFADHVSGNFRDYALIEFLKAHGAQSGRRPAR
jgi:hypothetical protein